jgi:tetratricopeptide (TPR) repeat protein
MRKRLYAGADPEVALGVFNLALARQAMGKTVQARQGLDEAIAMLRRCPHDVAAMLARMLWYSGRARLENKSGADAAAALPEVEEAVAIADQVLSPDHPHLEAYRATLAKCRAALEEEDKADRKEGAGRVR